MDAQKGAARGRMFDRLATLSLLFGSLVVLAGCADRTQQYEATFPVTKAECASTAIPNHYIVHWNDGSITVGEAADRESLIRDLIEPRIDEIKFAEQDQTIQLHNQPHTARPSTTFEIDGRANIHTWGPDKIQAEAAAAQGFEGQGVIVAVIDSGADTSHPQLKGQLAINSKEIPANGRDDDHNGLIDDVSGFDFELNTGRVTDGSGHGTHVAGVIVADATFGPVRGVAPKAKLLPLDFMNDRGSGDVSDAIAAMYYAAAQGAKVVNASWGGAPCSMSLERAIIDLEARGVLFVAAAGNSGMNLDYYPEFPAAFGLPGQLTVGASTQARDIMAGFSNYSPGLVNIMAPGEMIYSTYPGNRAVMLDGTSMAAPFVSAAAAVLWSARPQATVHQIKSALLTSVDRGPFNVSSGGRLNLARALATIQTLLP